jgi:hypothetical protein
MTVIRTGRSPLPPLSAVLATAALAAVMVVQAPEGVLLWALAGVMLPVAWLLLEQIAFAGKLSRKRLEARDRVRLAVTIAGVMLALPLALTAIFTSGVVTASDSIEQRALGAAFGLGIFIYGNWSTKVPVDLEARNAARDQANARYMAICFVLAGLGNALAWLFAPMAVAPWIAGGVLALPAIAVLIRVTRARATP